MFPLRPLLPFSLLLLLACHTTAQTNTHFTNPTMDSVVRGLYNPADYAASTVIEAPGAIASEVQSQLSPDSLKSFLTSLTAFGNRNTGSDTVSGTFGMGAARRWCHAKMQDFSAANEGRLLTGYLEFDRLSCGMGKHRNVVAVLPGADPSAEGMVLVEGHLDSRCDGVCDGLCIAPGADDNGSGSVLVLELARVMSRFTFDETILFMLTTGEEQGLLGAEAMAEYCDVEGIPIKAVFNNDIVGGIYCGNSASPPGCPGTGDIDSLNVRLFSLGGYNSANKQLARYTKLQYKEMLRPLVQVPMSINIMTGEDRVGRGGDHIPFRINGFKAIRMTSANEHGDGSPNSNYSDRQHTSSDSLGVDLDNNGTLDSFFVDFNYLARNARINAVAMGMAATGPPSPANFTATAVPGGIAVDIQAGAAFPTYRMAIRTVDNDWDSVYTFSNPIDTAWGLSGTVVLSVAVVDSEGVESLFSFETNVSVPLSSGEAVPLKGLHLLPNRPNPFDEQTTIGVKVDSPVAFQEAFILITDLQGRHVKQIPLTLEADINEVNFHHGFHASGTYIYSLVVDGVTVDSRRMVME